VKASRKQDYQDLIDYFTEERLRDRVTFLMELAIRFLENLEISKYIIINKRLIKEVVIDYFADIKRLKEFHGIEKTQPCKIAAYTAHWVHKRKPLHIKPNLDEEVIVERPCLLDMNEWFACAVMISIIFETKSRIVQNAEQLARFNNFQDTLCYFFTYRIVTPQSLELALLALSTEHPFEKLTRKPLKN